MTFSLPTRLALHAILNILLVALLDRLIPESFFISGGAPAYVIVGALISLMNMVVRPVLNLIVLPLRLFATIIAIILVNAIFLWITLKITMLMDPSLVILDIGEGIGGWITASLTLGFGNWVLHLIVR
jgi:uncharacterized membrane protein YvlD (DUF360 family)